MFTVGGEPSATACIVVCAFGWWKIYIYGLFFFYHVINTCNLYLKIKQS